MNKETKKNLKKSKYFHTYFKKKLSKGDYELLNDFLEVKRELTLLEEDPY